MNRGKTIGDVEDAIQMLEDGAEDETEDEDGDDPDDDLDF